MQLPITCSIVSFFGGGGGGGGGGGSDKIGSDLTLIVPL